MNEKSDGFLKTCLHKKIKELNLSEYCFATLYYDTPYRGNDINFEHVILKVIKHLGPIKEDWIEFEIIRE